MFSFESAGDCCYFMLTGSMGPENHGSSFLQATVSAQTIRKTTVNVTIIKFGRALITSKDLGYSFGCSALRLAVFQLDLKIWSRIALSTRQ
jgi:hypothetical protein